MIKVTKNSNVRKLARKLIYELKDNPTVEISAIGKDEVYKLVLIIATAGRWNKLPYPQTLEYRNVELGDKERTAIVVTLYR